MDIDMVSRSDELAELEGNEYIEKLEAIYNNYMKENLQISNVEAEDGSFGKQWRLILEDGMTVWLPAHRISAENIETLKAQGIPKKLLEQRTSSRGDKYYYCEPWGLKKTL